MGIRVGSVLFCLFLLYFFIFIFIFACYRFSSVLVCFGCFSMFKDRALSLCTNIFAFGNIMIW